jgi:uncharacterized protein YjcR
MAHASRVRIRARDLFAARLRLAEIKRRTGVSVSTLKRWAVEDDWKGQRDASDSLARASRTLSVRLAEAAAESADPQQAYGARTAAELAGMNTAPAAPAPTAAVMARALIEELAADPELGPILRRRRSELVQRVVAAAERLDAA